MLMQIQLFACYLCSVLFGQLLAGELALTPNCTFPSLQVLEAHSADETSTGYFFGVVDGEKGKFMLLVELL